MSTDVEPSCPLRCFTETEDNEGDNVEPYGCGKYKPKALQCMNSIQAHVIWQCVFNFCEGFVVNGIINVVIVALETRYALPSSMSGLISSSNDFGTFLVILPISYFGEHRHKPRLMAMGIVVMALGSLLFALPHFIGGEYEYTLSNNGMTHASTNLCLLNSSLSESCSETISQSKSSPLYALFLIGQMLLGVGACPLFTIGLTYIDENTTTKMTSFYTGWTFFAAAVGVAVGYVVGGQTLSIFVDINTVDPSSIPLTPADPQWVGAWWIGVLVTFIAFLLVSIPFLGYPKKLPGYAALQLKRKSEAHTDGAEDVTATPGFGKNIRDFPTAVLLLLKNPTYVLTCLGATVEAMIVTGLATFGAKLLQQKFHADITTAGLIMGIVTVPGAGGGMILGGYLVKRLDLKCRGILRLCAASAAVSLLLAPSFLAWCEDTPLSGITTSYQAGIDIPAGGLTSDCNSGCGCTTAGFEPLCVNSTIVYFSPCHAGCTSYTTLNGTKIYENCSCFDKKLPSHRTLNSSMATRDTVTMQWVRPGTCAESCFWLYVFSVLFFFIMLFTFSTMAPTVSALFRCVPHKQRSLGLGLQLLIARLIGTTPGPVLLGAILDSTCEVWQQSCGERGSCWVYSNNAMAYRVLAWWAGLKVLSIIFYGLASKVYKAPLDEIKR
ncbi:solute carrier organic anion transporter family member 4C1-like [Haliotis rufescens]|uniref:solute carrier organic anion transporter family member 4C1-like n=1 Tax=Haliotis rufescens TaxID=6454 RepID=UPI00201F8346|nr:solute carrier organic anion transporter family member 4C1-like [Haliotis rufescens]